MARHTRNIAKNLFPVTLKTVASQAGVAAGTVSSILNRAPQSKSIPQQTKDRVFAVALKLHYQPNPFARALRIGQIPAASSMASLTSGSRALVFEGEEHFRLAMAAIQQAGLRVPGDASAAGADDRIAGALDQSPPGV
jgi:DNA-binding LacI/PurR family transcriptional regulator